MRVRYLEHDVLSRNPGEVDEVGRPECDRAQTRAPVAQFHHLEIEQVAIREASAEHLGGYRPAGRCGHARSPYGRNMAVLQRVAPAFPVRDVRASLAHYERLGFATREYVGGDYGYATRDGIEIHLGFAPARLDESPRHSAYVWVDDADDLANEWRAAGAEVHGPEDTEWGQHEGALVDPDGNVIRFGSPIQRPS